MSVAKINKAVFEELKRGSKPIFVDFYADWCGPCRMLAPIVEKVASARPDVEFCKVNVDDEPELASEFGVFSIPALFVIKDGKAVASAVGAQPEGKILEMLDSAG